MVRKGTWIDIELSAFAAKVDDYILSTRLFSMDVNNDGVTDVVRGFRNVDAELAGGEAAAVARLAEGVTLPVSLAFVRGRNTTDGRDLPEIPPFNLEAALRYARPEGARPWWIQAGVRYDARQNKIDPLFPEDATPSWIVAHLRGGVTIGKGLTLEVGIENLLDEEYHEHLTREAALATGALMAGDEIPAPGRHVTVRLTMAF
jgi:iron complex outermembrane recepter protein